VRYSMLEPDAGKLARPVLRGGGAGNSTSLPDRRLDLPAVRGRKAVLTSDVATSETLAFVQAHTRPARLLEVGCGGGALAFRLTALGYQVVALDASADAVAEARQRGLDARIARWPDFEEAPFDVVLFTRSLHHIQPLDRAVARAKELLKTQGRVLVEDFAFSAIESLSAEWLYQLLSVLDVAGVLRCDGDDFANKILQGGGVLAVWQAAHDHHLHSADAMASSIREHFGAVEATTVPYLYRYVCALLEESADGYRLASRVLALEKRFAEVGRVPLIGRRFVGTRTAEPAAAPDRGHHPDSARHQSVAGGPGR
jgi:SAM-dependent methyltransferase